MIRAIGGSMPHEDHGTWERFLEKCDLRSTVNGVRFYGKVNCNYILFPTEELVCNYGYHGRALMMEIRDNGWQTTLERIKVAHASLMALFDNAKR